MATKIDLPKNLLGKLKTMNKNLPISIVIVLLLVGGLIFLSKSRSEDNKNSQIKNLESSGDLISKEGIHWHPELAIYIQGTKQEIPVNIGIGMQYAGYPRYDGMMMMTDIHTHDNFGTLHWEVMHGPVGKEEVKLGSFFAIWGKKFNNDCILEFCNGPDGQVKMLVNDKENTEFENYLVKDKDKIEIRYE